MNKHKIKIIKWLFGITLIFVSIRNANAQKFTIDVGLDRFYTSKQAYPFVRGESTVYLNMFYLARIRHTEKGLVPKLGFSYSNKRDYMYNISSSYLEVNPVTINYLTPKCNCENKDTIFPVSEARYYIFSVKLGIGKSIIFKKVKFYMNPNFTLNRVREDLVKPKGCIKNPTWPYTYHPEYFTFDFATTLYKMNVGCGIDAGIEYKNISIGYWNRFIAKQKLMTYNYFAGISIGYSLKLFKINQLK